VKPVWLVLPDPFSSRLFFDTGIVQKLSERLGDRLELFLLDTSEHAGAWRQRAGGLRFTPAEDLQATESSVSRRAMRRADEWLDRRVGFYPLSLRQSLREGFNRTRMQEGHQNWFLDPNMRGPLPVGLHVDPLLLRWHYGRLRYLPDPLLQRFRDERPAVALANIQMHAVVPFIVGAQRVGSPVVGHVASWDHTVGKGIVAPGLRRYIVQNEVMRDDLARYHGVDRSRVTVTGWPQTDVFHRRRPRKEYADALRGLGLDPSRPLVLVMGNTPTNAPYEQAFVQRLVSWWEKSGPSSRFSLLFRPHPRDREWRERFAAALSRPGVAVQEPSFTDIETLAVLLQHGHCVVSNAGTILLDSLVNDRPTVCVLYDEGAPEGESWAIKNVSGEHYKSLMESDAFYRAARFEDVVDGIERALAQPEELSAERRRAARDVVGDVDGRAAERVANAIESGVD
jgi:hypothetical protein